MQSWGLTDPGCVRTQNQDTYHTEQLDRNTLLCVVCDGMGGAKSGNIASSLALDVFVQEIKRNYHAGLDMIGVDQILERAVKLSNFTVFDQGSQCEEFEGMGTTLVAALTIPAANKDTNRSTALMIPSQPDQFHSTRWRPAPNVP